MQIPFSAGNHPIPEVEQALVTVSRSPPQGGNRVLSIEGAVPGAPQHLIHPIAGSLEPQETEVLG